MLVGKFFIPDPPACNFQGLGLSVCAIMPGSYRAGDDTEAFVFGRHKTCTTFSLMECWGRIQGFAHARKALYQLSSSLILWLQPYVEE